MASDSNPASGGRVSGPTSTPQRGRPRLMRRGSQSESGEELGRQLDVVGIQRSSAGSRKRGHKKQRASFGVSVGGDERAGKWVRV